VSKFQPLSAYQQPLIDGYQLLPFRFTLLDDHDYVLTNQAGEFIVLERPTLEALVRHQLSATDRLYDDLKSKHFIIDRDSSVAMDLIAAQSAHKATAARIDEYVAQGFRGIFLRPMSPYGFAVKTKWFNSRHMTQTNGSHFISPAWTISSRSIAQATPSRSSTRPRSSLNVAFLET
jgi:hypothetical protein